MDEHKKYLADRLLSEELPVTYRLLSRALNVHVNTAKEMLYEFHTSQNASKPGSVHATYLIHGVRPPVEANGNEDVAMSGSFDDNDSVSEDAPAMTLTLAREESLKDVLAGYQDVTSIHIYSLAPSPLKSLSMLSDVARSVAEYSAKEDSLSTAKTYGTIKNPYVRRRDLKTRRVAAPAPVSSSNTIKTAAPAKPTQADKVKQEVKQEAPSTTSSRESTPASATGKSTTAPAMKRNNSAGGIMSSFAKAKPPKPKAAVKKEEDTAMALSDDGEADDMDVVPTKKSTVDVESVRAAKKKREEELRRMMEDDDDDEDEQEEKEEAADEEMEEAPEPEPEPQPEIKEEKEPAEVISSSGDGRRRGRRKVMKKKRTLDSQGYMVTTQEAAWESFSEDEAPPPAKKVATAAPASNTASQGTTGKAKKPAGKGGQGSIMSFFSKK